MRVLLVILNSDPPQVSRFETHWSQDFRNFVSCCLTKDPTKRPSCSQILQDHKGFLDKAKDSAYIKENFLKGLAPIEQRRGKILEEQGKEYFAKKNKSANPIKKQKSNI
jgi:serine/threonine protein kinase